MESRNSAELDEQMEEADWSYDGEPAGPAPYKLLFALALAGVAAGLTGYGYYTFVDDNVSHPVIETLCWLLGLGTGVGLFAYAIRRDGFDAEMRAFYFLVYLLVPSGLGYLFFAAAGRLANVWLDFSTPRTSEYIVVSKDVATERRYNQVKPAGRVRMQSRETAQEAIVPMKTAEYNAAHAGDTYLVTTRAGALGRAWIVKANPAP